MRQWGRAAELSRGIDRSRETQNGCEQLNIERLFGVVMMSQAGEERKTGEKEAMQDMEAAASSTHWLLRPHIQIVLYYLCYSIDVFC